MEEEGEEELVSEDEDEEAPEAVPIGEDIVKINQERRVEESEVSDIDVDDYGSSDESSEYPSDELDEDTTANPHGFVYANMLSTYQKSRRERIADMRAERDQEEHRNKFKKKKQSKAIGKSEKVHAKNKPFMMVKQKKIS